MEVSPTVALKSYPVAEFEVIASSALEQLYSNYIAAIEKIYTCIICAKTVVSKTKTRKTKIEDPKIRKRRPQNTKTKTLKYGNEDPNIRKRRP